MASADPHLDTRHLVDPELLAALDQWPVLKPDADKLPRLRAARNALLPPLQNAPDVACEERHLPGPDGAPDVRALVYRPRNVATAEALPAVLHIHGGGYILGSPEMSDLMNVNTARNVGCVVVSVDYRLAPETPHPGPVEDCYAGLRWLHEHADELGVDRHRIAIKGESAGGGLAAGLALLARDRGEYAIAHQHLMYPMIDDREPASPHPYVGEFVWTRESNRFGWRCLLGTEPGSPDISPYAAAARATDLTTLPSAWIATGALDLFLEENLEYARRLTRAAVPVELHVYPGAYHGYPIAANARVARQTNIDSERALKRALGTGD